jgi:hypothetical protein
VLAEGVGGAHPRGSRGLRELPAMIDADVARFDVRALSRSEEQRNLSYTKNMLLATMAASLAIVGLGAFFLSLLL